MTYIKPHGSICAHKPLLHPLQRQGDGFPLDQARRERQQLPRVEADAEHCGKAALLRVPWLFEVCIGGERRFPDQWPSRSSAVGQRSCRVSARWDNCATEGFGIAWANSRET